MHAYICLAGQNPNKLTPSLSSNSSEYSMCGEAVIWALLFLAGSFVVVKLVIVTVRVTSSVFVFVIVLSIDATVRVSVVTVAILFTVTVTSVSTTVFKKELQSALLDARFGLLFAFDAIAL